MSLRQLGVNSERSFGGHLSIRKRGARSLNRVHGHERIRVSHSGVGHRVAGVLFDGLLELFERRIQPAMKTACPIASPLQITMIRSRIVRVLTDEWLPRELGQRD